jgi:PAS domain S-box-containing protein
LDLTAISGYNLPVIGKDTRRIFWAGVEGTLRGLTAEELLQELEDGELNLETLIRIEERSQPRPLRRYLRELVWLAHEQHLAEDEVQAEQSLFEAAFAHAPIGVVLSDLAGRLIHSNDAFCTMLGYRSDEICGLLVSELSEPTDREAEVALGNELLAGKRNSFQIEKRFRTHKGELIDTYTAISIVRDGSGVPLQVIAHIMDLTALKTLEKSRQLAEAESKAKTAFLSSMSHEIRTPMNAILGYAQLLYREEGLTTRQQEYLDTIDRSGKHLLALINGVLDMAKIEAGQDLPVIGDVDLHRLLTDVERMFRLPASEKGLAFTVRWSKALPPMVRTDGGKLRQILINLIGNAIKFTEFGCVDAQISVETAGRSRNLIVEISDTGCGIDSSKLAFIFGAFRQVGSAQQRIGTGLGLAVSREYARALGGDLTVLSTVGKGSTFRVAIVVEISKERHNVLANESMARVQAIRPKPHIMVVDDVVENRLLLRDMLQSIGLSVSSFSNAEEALVAIAHSPPGLLLVDLRMPEVDGIDMVRRLRGSEDTVPFPVVVVSASVLDSEKRDVIREGASAFVSKPILEEELFSTIANLLSMEPASSNPGVSQPSETQAPGHTDLQSEYAPPALLSSLMQAVLSGDMVLIEELLVELGASAPEFTEQMMRLSVNFEYEQLADAVAKRIAVDSQEGIAMEV